MVSTTGMDAPRAGNAARCSGTVHVLGICPTRDFGGRREYTAAIEPFTARRMRPNHKDELRRPPNDCDYRALHVEITRVACDIDTLHPPSGGWLNRLIGLLNHQIDVSPIVSEVVRPASPPSRALSLLRVA